MIYPTRAAVLAAAAGVPFSLLVAAAMPLLTPTSAFPSPILPFRHDLGAVGNRLSHRLVLAGLGGALGAEILGLDPSFPLKFMIYFLVVVTVGGTASISGAFLASLLLGIADVAGKYYMPQLGAFVIYSVMVAVLIWRPQGLFGKVLERKA